jgi:hypothetical protein
METLKHLLGFCGESHPNIFTFIILGLFVKFIFYKIYKYSKFYLK